MIVLKVSNRILDRAKCDVIRIESVLPQGLERSTYIYAVDLSVSTHQHLGTMHFTVNEICAVLFLVESASSSTFFIIGTR
jgi:hypothetical protein